MPTPKFPDRVRETSTTTGTGDLTLGGAVTLCRSFAQAVTDGDMADGDTVRFCTALRGGAQWEVAEGVYDLGTLSLSRDTILASSSGGSAVSFGVGTKDVFVVLDGSMIASLIAGGGVTSVNLTQPSAGITVAGGPITSSGSITLALANDLAALEGLGNGYPKRTGTDTWTAKSATQVTADLDVFVGDTGSPSSPIKGLVPAPTPGDAVAGKFLKADGTFAVPAGSGGGDLTLLGSQVASGNPAALSVTGITGSGYTDLVVVVRGRSTASSSVDDQRVIINGDTTGANYSNSIFVEGSGSGPGGSNNAATSGGAAIGVSSGVSGNADAMSVTEFTIYNYAAACHKIVIGSSFCRYSAQLFKKNNFAWLSNSAVTSVSVAATGTSWVDTISSISVYGRK